MPDPKPIDPHDIGSVPIALHMQIDTAALLLHAVELARANVSLASAPDYILDLERLELNLRDAIVRGGAMAMNVRNAAIAKANVELEGVGLRAPTLDAVSFARPGPKSTER